MRLGLADPCCRISSVPASGTGCTACVDCCTVLFGAEMVVLEGKRGDIGVNGSSEADGDGDMVDERSPARAANSGRAALRDGFLETPRKSERPGCQIGSVGTSLPHVVTIVGGGPALPGHPAEAVEDEEMLRLE
jgi:hypothetical protein